MRDSKVDARCEFLRGRRRDRILQVVDLLLIRCISQDRCLELTFEIH